MKEFTIGKNDAGQRLDRWVAKTLPLLPAPLAQKYIRLKRVKVNGKGSQRDVRLQLGDILQLYINDEFFEQPREENAFLSVFKPHLDIVYEDENLMLLRQTAWPAVPRGRARKGEHPHHPYPGLPLPKEGVEPPGRALLYSGPVQPHRPQHRRHRHGRQERRDPAHP